MKCGSCNGTGTKPPLTDAIGGFSDTYYVMCARCVGTGLVPEIVVPAASSSTREPHPAAGITAQQGALLLNRNHCPKCDSDERFRLKAGELRCEKCGSVLGADDRILHDTFGEPLGGFAMKRTA